MNDDINRLRSLIQTFCNAAKPFLDACEVLCVTGEQMRAEEFARAAYQLQITVTLAAMEGIGQLPKELCND